MAAPTSLLERRPRRAETRRRCLYRPMELERIPIHGEVVVSQCIAVINGGSSSIKFALYDAAKEETCLFRGQIDAIGVAPR